MYFYMDNFFQNIPTLGNWHLTLLLLLEHCFKYILKLDIRSVERGICPIAALYLLHFPLVSYNFFYNQCWSPTATLALKFQHLGHVTSSVTWQLDQQFMVSCWSVITTRLLHGYWELKTEGLCGYDLDFLGHVTSGYVTIKLAMCGFL